MEKVTQAGDNIMGGDYHGLGDVSGGLPDVSGAGEVRLISNGGVPHVSSKGNAYRPLFLDVHAAEFGVVADDSTDCTAAIQAALDWGLTQVDLGIPVKIVFPPGVMCISSTIIWKGNGAGAPALSGAASNGQSYDVRLASVFKWVGANNGTMMYAQRCNKGVMEDLKFNGNNVAGICLHLAAAEYADREVLAATAGIRINRCFFGYVKVATTGNGCVLIGSDDHPGHPDETWEQADVRFDNSSFYGESSGAPGFTYAGMKAYGVKLLQGGNVKLFSFNYCEFVTCDVGLDATAGSGPVNFLIAQFGDVREAFRFSGGMLSVIGADIECNNTDDFRLLTGTGQAGCSVFFQGLEVAAFMAGALGTLIDSGASVTLQNSYLFNNNKSVASPQPNPFKIIAGGVTGVTTGVSFKSKNNWYVCPNSDGYIPIYDGSGNHVVPSEDYGWSLGLTVSSEGDTGGVPTPVGSGTVTLADFNSNPTTFFETYTNSIRGGYEVADPDTSSTLPRRTFQVVDCTGGAEVITLPTAAAANKGRVIWVSKSDASANTLTVTNTSTVLRSQYETAQFVSNGSAWVPYGRLLTDGAQRINGAKTFSAPIIHSETGSITAHTGGGQGSATALTTDVNVVATVASGNDSVKLPATVAGLQILVFNAGANTVDIYPASGSAIDALGANTPYSLAAAASRLFVGTSSTLWLSR
jgi:hypothetical protein